MQLYELKKIIQGAGGQHCAQEYAEALLEKLNRIESSGRYSSLIVQLSAAREQGDFRGRVLEVNFLNLFLLENIYLQYSAKQDAAGDIDFCWDVDGYKFFIEMKLLGQDKRTRESINEQIQATGCSATLISDDTSDVARIQRDIFQKSSTKKFNTQPESNWINLVAIDVSELQLGTVDLGDCLLAALGNEGVLMYCHPTYFRPAIVGVFENSEESLLQDAQIKWKSSYHTTSINGPHPRGYIHGVLFLFREPQERAALCYELSAAVVWNSKLINPQIARVFCKSFHKIVPCKK